MEFVKGGTVDEFKETSHKVIKLLGRPVGIIRRDDGSFFAVEASCKHQGADILADYRGGPIAVCPRHQWEYELESGRCVNHQSLPLKRYRIRIEGDDIMVSLQPMEAEVQVDYDYDRLK